MIPDREMLRLYAHEVAVPADEEPAAWAARHAAAPPTIVPDGWPASTLFCPAVVVRNCPDPGCDCTTTLLVVTRPAAMHALVAFDNPQLWFRLPRSLLAPALCPDLKPEHWPEGE